MIHALIDGARIAQLVATEPECFPVAEPLAWISVPDGTTEHDTYVDGVVVPYVPPAPPLVETISRRQFFQQAAIAGLISEVDALAANAAVIPPAMAEIINDMPADKQFGVRMLVSGAVTFERNHQTTIDIGAALDMSPEDIDAFWRAAALL